MPFTKSLKLKSLCPSTLANFKLEKILIVLNALVMNEPLVLSGEFEIAVNAVLAISVSDKDSI